MSAKGIVAIVVGLAILTAVPFVSVFAVDTPKGEVPGPYRGSRNPLSWDDAAVRAAGKGLYTQFCASCHGPDGRSVKQSDFGTPDSPRALKEAQDYFYWRLTEGKLDKGMPPYKSSLSDTQRWQLITYMASIGDGAPPPTPAIPFAARPEKSGLVLSVVPRAIAGQTLDLAAVLTDVEGKPMPNSMVRYFSESDFFVSGLVEIGQATTNERGIAVVKYRPRGEGDVRIVARHDASGQTASEVSATVSVAPTSRPIYHTEVGIRLPALGPELLAGPQVSLEAAAMAQAPGSVFRLPGGTLSWLLLFAAVVALVFSAYGAIFYQVLRISWVGASGGQRLAMVPWLGLAVAVGLGLLSVMMILTGPDTHLNLQR